jgi:hypothetical protein
MTTVAAIPPFHAGGTHAEPLIHRPFRPDKAAAAGLSGRFANTHDQRSQGAMTMEILYA